jgi:hypothetical protein
MIDQIHQVFMREVKFLQTAQKDLIEHEEAIAALQARRQEIEAELRPMKSKLAAEQEALRVAREERNREIAELDKAIESKQQKVSALDTAIEEKAKEFGGLIARELV